MLQSVSPICPSKKRNNPDTTINSPSIFGWIKPTLLTAFLLLILLSGNSRLGPLPPLGKFCNPFSGFWKNAESGIFKDQNLHIPGLHETVTVVFDKRGVPHIFAQNNHDLFLAQGYVTARDRLWQMEIQVMSAAGRLAEILGPSMVAHDRFQRRLGIPQGAERDLDLMFRHPDSWEAASAYSEGVNAYISSLKKSDYPLEYKLMDYAPRHWTALNTALLIKHMQWTLSGGGDDLPLTNTLKKFGPEFVRKFYPLHEPGVEPVIPTGTRWDSLASVPALPFQDSLGIPPLFPGMPNLPILPMVPSKFPTPTLEKNPDPGNGSNNFVLSGSKSHSGYPLLANDPHLDLGLPSLWYEVQLSAPSMSVYGVSLPGAPGVLIGFNRKIAWGMTNGYDDVFDWYRVAYRDSTLSEYLYDGKWKPVRKDIQAIKVRGESTIFDTVLYTHQGPIVQKSQEQTMNRDVPPLHALHWLAFEPSDELHSILKIDMATDFEEFSTALQDFQCPSQNFAFASVRGDIAMFHNGRFPQKWRGQGRFILDGTEPGNDWSGWIPQSQAPQVHNPANNRLFSANQDPTDSTYPYYLGSNFKNGERAKRLGQILDSAQAITADQAFGILLDNYDLHAAEVLPFMLLKLKSIAVTRADSAALQALAHWDYRHTPGASEPALFDLWWKQFYHSIWHDEFGEDSVRYQWPSQDRTRQLVLEESQSEFFDDITTPAKETLDFLLARSLHEAGQLLGHQATSWSAFRPVEIRHLAHIDAFSALHISTGGCGTCVNAQKVSHGPSWRMVVTLGKEPQAIGIYPGGQSGNPGSVHYDEFINDWAGGRNYPLTLQSGPGDPGAMYNLQLRGK